MRSSLLHLAPGDNETLVHRAGETLIEAFVDDPLLELLAPEPIQRRHLVELVYPLILRVSLPEDQTYVAQTDDGEVAGAIALIPPGRYPLPALRIARQIPSFVAGVSGLLPSLWRMFPGIGYASASGRLHVKGPHWFVMVVGVAPRFQGQGVGGLLMRHAIDLAEADCNPLYLETESLKNVSFYEHLGFELVGRVHPHPKGPELYAMLRS
jgi:GNAT superfamily N-acetyltransferase